MEKAGGCRMELGVDGGGVEGWRKAGMKEEQEMARG